MARGYEIGENEFLLVEDRDLERARSERPAPAGAVELAAPRRESPPIAPAGVQNDTREGSAGETWLKPGERVGGVRSSSWAKRIRKRRGRVQMQSLCARMTGVSA